MAYPRHFFLWDLLTQARRCPWCGCADVHVSKHPLPLLSVFRCETWRCYRCGRRFPLRPKGAETPAPELETTRRRRPAGAALRSLDATLADVLRPGQPDEVRAAAAAAAEPKPDAPAQERPSGRSAGD